MDPNGYQRLHGIALAFYELGRRTEFEAAFTELRELWSDDAAEAVAQIYAWTGEIDEAFGWLDKVVKKKDFRKLQDYQHPLYRDLHADARWHSLLETRGRSPAQLAVIEFEVNLPD
ncbi:MAG: hypothetical protein O6931_05405 [Gammaproteobacteria bacterium]|nr:hypothetical protein [Gammaproteobacteria bacterium]